MTHGRHLLHGVGGHDTEDDRDSRVQASAQHAARGRADDSIKVRRGPSHLRTMNDHLIEQLQAEEADIAWAHVAPVTPMSRAVPVLRLPQALGHEGPEGLMCMCMVSFLTPPASEIRS